MCLKGGGLDGTSQTHKLKEKETLLSLAATPPFNVRICSSDWQLEARGWRRVGLAGAPFRGGGKPLSQWELSSFGRVTWKGRELCEEVPRSSILLWTSILLCMRKHTHTCTDAFIFQTGRYTQRGSKLSLADRWAPTPQLTLATMCWAHLLGHLPT